MVSARDVLRRSTSRRQAEILGEEAATAVALHASYHLHVVADGVHVAVDDLELQARIVLIQARLEIHCVCIVNIQHGMPFDAKDAVGRCA